MALIVRLRILVIPRFKPASRWSFSALLILATISAGCLTNPANQAGSTKPSEGTTASAGIMVPLKLVKFDLYGQVNHQFDPILGKTLQIDGLPFQIRGAQTLFGQFSENRLFGFRQFFKPVNVGQKFDELHLIHCTGYSADPIGAPVGYVRLNYEDGSHYDFEIVYGRQVLDWLQTPYDAPERLTDPDTKIVFRGPGLPEVPGSTIRLFKTVFRNPSPDKLVSSIRFASARGQSCYDVVAATVARSDSSRPQTLSVPADGKVTKVTSTVRVQVEDEATGKPLAGVVVMSSPEFYYTWATAGVTSLDGLATLQLYGGQPAGAISAWKTGYTSEVRFIPGRNSTQITLTMKPALKLTGRVLDLAGHPVRNAIVAAGFGPGEELDLKTRTVVKTATDGSGTFKMDNLRAGRVQYIVTAAGHAPQTGFWQVPSDLRQEIVLDQGIVFRGRVVDRSGKPVAGANVKFVGFADPFDRGVTDQTQAFQVNTATDGGFVWNSAPEGVVINLRISVPGNPQRTVQAVPEAGVVTKIKLGDSDQ